MTRIIELKEVVVGTFYRPPEGTTNVNSLSEVPTDAEYDSKTMIRQIFSYKSTLIGILKTPSDRERGMDYEDMQVCVDVIRKLKEYNDGDKVPLDDELYSKLEQKVKATKWMIATEEAVQFVQDIIHAPAISKEKLDKAAADDTTVDDTDTELNGKIMRTAPPVRKTPLSFAGSKGKKK